MSHIIRLPSINSTNVRFMFETLARRLAYRASAALAPSLAVLWAERMFLTPPRATHPESAFFDLIDAQCTYVVSKGRHIATWRWGPSDAPAVVLAHGWGGRASQMRAFVMRLAAAGFRVIAYDQPAHGRSEGEVTGLPDFADALAAVAAHHGGVQAVIAHSLGGAGAAIAIAQGLSVRRTVLISPPSDLLGHSRRFARWFRIPERVRRAMQAAVEERYGVRWAELETHRLAPRLDSEALVIHDRDDRVVPFRQGVALAQAWPGARLLATEGLGHGRILEDEGVSRAAVEFIAGHSRVASPAAPQVPVPAPIY